MAAPAPPAHRLVVLGDSLSHGFQSLAVYNTRLSYPALVAARLGLGPDQVRVPGYRPAAGEDFMGPPLNLEYLARHAGEPDCSARSPLEQLEAGVKAFGLLVRLHAHWDSPDRIRELGLDHLAPDPPVMHNLGVAVFDVRDLLGHTADLDLARLNRWAEFTDLGPIATNGRSLMSLPVTATARRQGVYLEPVRAAAALAAEGGIETLIVFIGANNALGTVISMDVRESDAGYDSMDQKGRYNLWRPDHFAAEYGHLVDAVRGIGARHVLFATVPHVTAAPLAHGIGGRVEGRPEFFNFYTYPWIPEGRFRPALDPHLTGAQAMHIDEYVDAYNLTIRAAVERGRAAGLSWHLVDVCALMDSLAYRRYWEPGDDRLPEARRRAGLPDADDYAAVLPPALRELTRRGRLGATPGDPVLPPDSRFFRSDAAGRSEGGLVSLDGIHPTTIGYGILAEAFLRVMATAGVAVGDPAIDFEALVRADSLVGDPPTCVQPDLKGLGWGEVGFDWVNGLAKTLDRPKPHHDRTP